MGKNANFSGQPIQEIKKLLLECNRWKCKYLSQPCVQWVDCNCCL